MGVVAPFVFTSDTETVTKDKLNDLVADLLTEFNGSIDDGNIEALGVGTTSLAAKSVTLAKVADGTQGGILYFGASGVIAELAAGTSGLFLKTQGAAADPIWAVANLTAVDVAATGGYLGAAYNDGVLRTADNAVISYTDGGDFATLDIAANGINDTHVDWGAGANQVDSDDVPEGSTNKYFPYSGGYSKVSSDGGDENITLLAVDLRDKWIDYKAIYQLTNNATSAAQGQPGAAGEGNLRNVHGTENGVSGDAPIWTNGDYAGYSSGLFWTTAAGIADPSTGAAIQDGSGGILDDSVSSRAGINAGDTFIYCDNTNGYLRIHISDLDAGYFIGFCVVVTVLGNTNL